MASNQPQTRHPEMVGDVAWMPVSLQQSPPPVEPMNLAPLGWVLVASVGLLAGLALSVSWKENQISQANQRAAQAETQLQANQRAIDQFCKGVSK